MVYSNSVCLCASRRPPEGDVDVWCSPSVAKVSACHREAIRMLRCGSHRRDVRTVSPLFYSDIFVYLFCVFSVFGTQPSKTRRFRHCLIKRTRCLFSLPHSPPSRSEPPPPSSSSTRSLQRRNSRLDSSSPPALKTRTPGGSNDRRRANAQVTMTRGGQRWREEAVAPGISSGGVSVTS